MPPSPRAGEGGSGMTVFVYEHGQTTTTDPNQPRWLHPDSGITLWVDLVNPSPDQAQEVLGTIFHFHPLSIEDALADIHDPKIEPYDKYLYVILHGIDFHGSEHRFATRDI